MRWTLISVPATTVLAVTRARTTTAAPSDHRLIPPSVCEVLRLLQITAPPATRPRPRPALVRLAPATSNTKPPEPTALEQHHRHSNHLTNSNDPPINELQPPWVNACGVGVARLPG